MSWKVEQWILLMAVCTAVVGRPTNNNVKLVSSLEGGIPESDLVGSNIDSLLSQMYNNLIQSRLDNLLQGVEPSSNLPRELTKEFSNPSSTLTRDLTEDLNDSDSEKDFVEVFLPKAVTEIPSKLFTSLPGRNKS